MTSILAGTQGHVLPEVNRVLVAQVVAVQTDLVVTLGHCGPVSGHDAVVSQERGNHVDGIGPRKVHKQVGYEWSESEFYQSWTWPTRWEMAPSLVLGAV